MHRARATAVICALLGCEAVADTLSGEELHGLCRAYLQAPASERAKACETYVQGYLDGIRSGAEIEARPPERRAPPESWSERAARIRLGSTQLDHMRKPDQRYCLPEPVATSEIIGQLVDYLGEHRRRRTSPAAEALAETLRRHHAC